MTVLVLRGAISTLWSSCHSILCVFVHQYPSFIHFVVGFISFILFDCRRYPSRFSATNRGQPERECLLCIIFAVLSYHNCITQIIYFTRIIYFLYQTVRFTSFKTSVFDKHNSIVFILQSLLYLKICFLHSIY